MNRSGLLILFCLVSGCAQLERIHHGESMAQPKGVSPNADLPAKIDLPPSGDEVIRILLKNQSFPLKNTGCSSGSDDHDSLQDLLARTLGAAIGVGADRQMVVSGGCNAEQFELYSGTILDGWRCRLNVEERFIKDNEYVYNFSVAFGIRKDTWALITDSVTPSPLVCIP